MREVMIRPVEPDSDAAAVVSLINEAFPFRPTNEASIAVTLRSTENRTLTLIAEFDKQVIGYGTTSLLIESARPSSMSANVVVAASDRRRGIGTALLESLARHWADVGATNVTSRACDEGSIAFGERNGFIPGRIERISHVALADVPAPVPVPDPYKLRFLVDADERDLYLIDQAVLNDIPSEDGFAAIDSFDEWKKLNIGPRMSPETTALAYLGDEPVSVSWLDRVGDKVWSSLSGTLSEHRGKGLAKVVKTHSLNRARELGAVSAFTNNDATNAPMLAVNTWLGYRLYTEQHTMTRELA